MNLVTQAWLWLTDSANWVGISGIPNRLVEHITVTFLALLVALIIAVPIGMIIGHTAAALRWWVRLLVACVRFRPWVC